MAKQYRSRLREILITYYDEEELRDLCFELGIEYDDLRGGTRKDKARELLAHLERHQRLADLVAHGRENRPSISWPMIGSARPQRATPRRLARSSYSKWLLLLAFILVISILGWSLRDYLFNGGQIEGTATSTASDDIAVTPVERALDSALSLTAAPTDKTSPDTVTSEILAPMSTQTPLIASSGRILFASRGDIWVINADGSGLTNLTDHPAYDESPEWSPDGKNIVFSSDRDGNKEIYVMNADGTDPLNLTDNSARDMNPSWSPDGGKIAFDSNREGSLSGANIYVMNTDGTGQVRLTTRNGFRPFWSPDGHYIVYTMLGNEANIHLMTAEGINDAPALGDSQDSTCVAWSPDGAQFAIRANLDGKDDVYIVGVDQSPVIRLTNDSTTEGSSLAWSPDGSRIAFIALRDGKNDIYLTNVDGTEQVNLTNDSAEYSNLRWFYDGQWIAFARGESGSLYGDLYVMKADGTSLSRLTYSLDISLLDSYFIDMFP